jgi:hypothetical protein
VTSALCGAAGWLSFLPRDGMNQLILFRALQGVARAREALRTPSSSPG